MQSETLAYFKVYVWFLECLRWCVVTWHQGESLNPGCSWRHGELYNHQWTKVTLNQYTLTMFVHLWYYYCIPFCSVYTLFKVIYWLRKAFDMVDLDILLAKLPSFGVEGVEHQWFRSYLTGRVQSVTVDGHLSDPLPVFIGALQGSILGPLLFLLFWNDLHTILQSCETTMYADDTECESVSKPDQMLLCSD